MASSAPSFSSVTRTKQQQKPPVRCLDNVTVIRLLSSPASSMILLVFLISSLSSLRLPFLIGSWVKDGNQESWSRPHRHLTLDTWGIRNKTVRCLDWYRQCYPAGSICLLTCLSACLPACLSVCLSVYLSVCMSIYPPTYVPIYLIYLSTYLLINQFAHYFLTYPLYSQSTTHRMISVIACEFILGLALPERNIFLGFVMRRQISWTSHNRNARAETATAKFSKSVQEWGWIPSDMQQSIPLLWLLIGKRHSGLVTIRPAVKTLHHIDRQHSC